MRLAQSSDRSGSGSIRGSDSRGSVGWSWANHTDSMYSSRHFSGWTAKPAFLWIACAAAYRPGEDLFELVLSALAGGELQTVHKDLTDTPAASAHHGRRARAGGQSAGVVKQSTSVQPVFRQPGLGRLLRNKLRLPIVPAARRAVTTRPDGGAALDRDARLPYRSSTVHAAGSARAVAESIVRRVEVIRWLFADLLDRVGDQVGEVGQPSSPQLRSPCSRTCRVDPGTGHRVRRAVGIREPAARSSRHHDQAIGKRGGGRQHIRRSAIQPFAPV